MANGKHDEMSSTSANKKLADFFNDPEIKKVNVIQSLWSGFGEIARYFSPLSHQYIILKQVQLPQEFNHPRGWNTQVSQQRKILSYAVEQRFYADYAKSCDDSCRVPKYLGSLSVEQSMPAILLQDLDAIGYDIRHDEAGLNEVNLCLTWLAEFHATFMGTSAKGLWPIGTYWHLGTRQEELKVMPDSPLKYAAQEIDNILNQCSFQTLVHGDAKLANFCFHPDDFLPAAVDFQYVGKGVGIKDVMYLLGSCLDSSQLVNHYQLLIDRYFLLLHQALKKKQMAIDFASLEREWRDVSSLVWADFHRFLEGWNPNHFKINQFMQNQTELALAIVNR